VTRQIPFGMGPATHWKWSFECNRSWRCRTEASASAGDRTCHPLTCCVIHSLAVSRGHGPYGRRGNVRCFPRVIGSLNSGHGCGYEGGDMIPVEVHSKSPLEGDVVVFIQHRMSFAFDRFRHLRRIHVFIEDVNGPKGGSDKRCRVVAEFAFASVVVQETQPTWQSAVARAIHRIGRNAVRRLQRMNRGPGHHRPRTIRRYSGEGSDA